MKCKLMGLMGREAAVAIIETLELPISPEDYMTSSQQIMGRMFPSCTFLPGQRTQSNTAGCLHSGLQYSFFFFVLLL